MSVSLKEKRLAAVGCRVRRQHYQFWRALRRSLTSAGDEPSGLACEPHRLSVIVSRYPSRYLDRTPASCANHRDRSYRPVSGMLAHRVGHAGATQRDVSGSQGSVHSMTPRRPRSASGPTTTTTFLNYSTMHSTVLPATSGRARKRPGSAVSRVHGRADSRTSDMSSTRRPRRSTSSLRRS